MGIARTSIIFNCSGEKRVALTRQKHESELKEGDIFCLTGYFVKHAILR
jgi:hypothetical protein